MKYGGIGQDLVIWGDCGGVIRVGWSGRFPHIHYITLHILPIANAKLHVVKNALDNLALNLLTSMLIMSI